MLKFGVTSTVVGEIRLLWQTSESCIGFEDEKTVDDRVELLQSDLEEVELAAHKHSIQDLDIVDVVALIPAMKRASVLVHWHALCVIMWNDLARTICFVPERSGAVAQSVGKLVKVGPDKVSGNEEEEDDRDESPAT